MKQYQKGKLWRRAVILTILAALETPFNTGTYALFFWLMETGRLDYLFFWWMKGHRHWIKKPLQGYMILF